MLTDHASNDVDTKTIEILKELEKQDAVKEADIPKEQVKPHTKPEWADKKDDEYNTYEYSDKDEVDQEW